MVWRVGDIRHPSYLGSINDIEGTRDYLALYLKIVEENPLIFDTRYKDTVDVYTLD